MQPKHNNVHFRSKSLEPVRFKKINKNEHFYSAQMHKINQKQPKDIYVTKNHNCFRNSK